MQYLEIRGGRPLEGEITVQGSKNAALPVLTSCFLGEGPCVIENCPQIQDVEDTLTILRQLGCVVQRDGSSVSIWGDNAENFRITGPEAARIRSSVLFLGALLGKMKNAVLPAPGGCAIGKRPVDLHLQALKLLGAGFTETTLPGYAECGGNNCSGTEESGCGFSEKPCEEKGSTGFPGEPYEERDSAGFPEKQAAGEGREALGGFIRAQAEFLQGARIRLPFPSVGATENVILAAVCARGETILENAAQEPEIEELCSFLNRRGADIVQRRDGSIRLRGVYTLHPVSWRLRPDRIAAGTWLLAAAGAGGRICLRDCPAGELAALFPILWQMGAAADCEDEGRRLYLVQERRRPEMIPYVETAPYPGFPTDLQSPLMAALVRACGRSAIRETIFERRFQTAVQLRKLGAEIAADGCCAVIEGVKRLHAARLLAPDLRGGAALAAAALQTEGVTRIYGYKAIARGYQDFAGSLRELGAAAVLCGQPEDKFQERGR